jgi:hypothetical protein
VKLCEDDVSRVRELEDVLLDMDWWLHEVVQRLNRVEKLGCVADEDLYRAWESIQYLRNCLAKLEEIYRELLAKHTATETEKL